MNLRCYINFRYSYNKKVRNSCCIELCIYLAQFCISRLVSGVFVFCKLCSKGAALGKPFEASPKDISSIASFIETKLVICYLKMRKPDLALNHSHR